MYDRSVSIYPSTIQFVPGQFETHDMCDKAIDTCPFVCNFVSD